MSANQTDPPLVTLWDVLRGGGETSMTTHILYEMEPLERFMAFAKRLPSEDLATRSVGNYSDLHVAYENAWVAEWLIQSMAREIYDRKLTIERRAMVSGVCLIAGSSVIDSAIILYLRPEPWTDFSLCTLVRSALEVAGCAAFIAQGTADEVDRFSTDKPRIEPWEKVKSLRQLVRAARPTASDPYDHVYTWLCKRTHMQSEALEPFMKHPPEPKHEECYAALAYVGWALAVVTEYVSGRPSLAKWPNMPAKLPWD